MQQSHGKLYLIKIQKRQNLSQFYSENGFNCF